MRGKRLGRSWLVVLLLLILASTSRPLADEPVHEHEVVGQAGMAYFVYVSPDGLEDKFYVAQVLDVISREHGKDKIILVMMFDDKRHTPRGFPMTDTQMKHQKAQYNYNPHSKHEKFVWITVLDADSSPPEMKHTSAEIRPGFAD